MVKLPVAGFAYSAELHHRLAANDMGYTWEEFAELDGEEQSKIVVVYECKLRINAIISYQQFKRAVKAGRRSGR